MADKHVNCVDVSHTDKYANHNILILCIVKNDNSKIFWKYDWNKIFHKSEIVWNSDYSIWL